MKQRRLARTRRAHHRNERPIGHLHRHGVKRGPVPVPLADIHRRHSSHPRLPAEPTTCSPIEAIHRQPSTAPPRSDTPATIRPHDDGGGDAAAVIGHCAHRRQLGHAVEGTGYSPDPTASPVVASRATATPPPAATMAILAATHDGGTEAEGSPYAMPAMCIASSWSCSSVASDVTVSLMTARCCCPGSQASDLVDSDESAHLI